MGEKKEQWPRGPWDTEPDDSDWITAAGLRAKALRHHDFGNWCGYVEVPKDHPLFGVAYNAPSETLADALERRKQRPIGENPSFAVLIACALGGGVRPSPDTVFEVHGGITYSGDAYWAGGEKGTWWYGFDCAHCDDIQPGMMRPYTPPNATYRDLAYVFAECERLAEQLALLSVAKG